MRKSKEQRREERQRRRESTRTKRADLSTGGADARREYFYGNLLRLRRQRLGGGG